MALDRWTIQLAARAMRFDPVPSGAAGVPSPNLGSMLPETGASPRDWTWTDAGTFRFSSTVQTSSPENNVVHGRFFPAAKQWQNRPTAVLLHGWNAELCYRRLFPYIARRFRSVGLNTAILELPYHMHRRPREGPVRDFISTDLHRMLEATRQALADTQALCRFFEAQGSPGVGVWGFSLGAWLAGLLTWSEARLRFAVLATPVTRIDRVIQDLAFCEPVRRSLEREPIDLAPLNLAARAPVLDPRRILLVEARHDLFAPAATVEELWQAWQQPDILRLSHGHISLLMSLPVMERIVRWAGKQ